MDKPWLTTDVTRLQAMAEAGQSTQAIARALGRKPHEVQRIRKRMGLDDGETPSGGWWGSWTHDEEERLKALLDEGLSYDAIAVKLGKPSRNSIAGAVRRLKLANRGTRSIKRSTKFKETAVPALPKPEPKPRVAKAEQRDASEPEPIGPEGDFPPAGGCQWTHGFPMVVGQTWRMCGHPAKSGPYCDFHMAKAGGNYAKKVMAA